MASRQAAKYLFIPAVATLILTTGCATLILRKGFPNYQGYIQGLPLHNQVEVLRDSWGIPHIYARDEHDLMVGQGFVHAQDRLWQMESIRRLTQGRLSEVAGEEALKADYFARLLGLPQLKSRAIKALSPKERTVLQAYVDGVNAFLRLRGEDLPLEFRFTGLKPEPWSLDDLYSIWALISWIIQNNYRQELLALKAGQVLGLDQCNELFPSHPGAVLPQDEYFERIRHMKVGPLIPEALAFYDALPEGYPDATGEKRSSNIMPSGKGGSNNWVVASSRDGRALLANDPHLGLTVPQIWYFCHLYAPGIHAAGASLAGSPGIVIGHNGRVAWGVTNLMTDCADLFLVQVDPDQPTRYYVAGRTMEMEQERVVFKLPKGKSRQMIIYRTIYGPVITRLEKGVEAAAALKWYGTLPEGALEDHTFRSLLSIYRVRNVAESLDSGKHMSVIGMNLVAADKEGHIGWQATGAVPIRQGYSGRLPADGSSGSMDWAGFLPYSKLPCSEDPPEGWLATANQRVVKDGEAHPISFSWCSPYRYERIAALLQNLPSPSLEDFHRIQMDVHSLQAESLLPRILSYQYRNCKARKAIKMLREWDREVRTDSRAAALYEVFLTEWLRTLLEDELGEDLALYFHFSTSLYSIQDIILDRPDSSFWDRKDTPEREGPQEILEMSLIRAVEWLGERLGPSMQQWSWGRLHNYEYRHPGARGSFITWLLNRGPFPAKGDNTTVNAGIYCPADGEYRVSAIPSLRMIVPLSDLDQTRIMGPMGQSGQPGHPHYDDMIEHWINGEAATLAFSRQAVERGAVTRLFLTP
ncbi:Acyl-homoserine lactone acylase QuiP [subsurface metagenome]